MTYLADPIHLIATFTSQEDGISIRWESPVIGVRNSHVTLPYQGTQLALVIRALDLAQSLGDPQTVFTTHEQTKLIALGLLHPGGWMLPHAYQRVGRALYRALCADTSGAQALSTVRDYATAQNRPVALSLRLPPDDVSIAALPWELLWDEGQAPLLLSRGHRSTCTRYLDLAQAVAQPVPHTPPLRILALAPRAGISRHIRDEERRARQTAWKPLIESGQVVMDELDPVTPQSLVDALQTRPMPDVIHYYGHGRYANGTGALLLDSQTGGACWTDASVLMALLGGVRMVVLFACQGAMVGYTNDLLTGIAPALSAAGIPIVVGMQFTVRVRAATRASGVMYRALVAGWSIQQAVSLVRQALYVEETDRASWYVPALYIRAEQPEPVYLIAPSARGEADTPALAAAAPPVRGTRQVVVARQNSRVNTVRMQGGNGSEQAVHALDKSAVEQATMRAAPSDQQHIQAEAASDISDVELDATI